MRFADVNLDHGSFDYSLMEGLEPDFSGRSLSGPAFLEAIPPPAHSCIQLHRLKKGQNLAHLFLLYHHFGAKAIILVNTEDNFTLSQELMDTIPGPSREGIARINCVLVSKAIGSDILKTNNNLQGSVSCEICPHSCEDVEVLLTPPFSTSQYKPKKGLLPAVYLADLLSTVCLTLHNQSTLFI